MSTFYAICIIDDPAGGDKSQIVLKHSAGGERGLFIRNVTPHAGSHNCAHYMPNVLEGL